MSKVHELLRPSTRCHPLDESQVRRKVPEKRDSSRSGQLEVPGKPQDRGRVITETVKITQQKRAVKESGGFRCRNFVPSTAKNRNYCSTCTNQVNDRSKFPIQVIFEKTR